jgi:lactate dehydrogenase-like 2-hydroxyacid dehydrogenase
MTDPKPALLQLAPLMAHVETALSEHFDMHRHSVVEAASSLPPAIATQIRAVATDGHYGIPSSFLPRLPSLEIVASYGVGYDAIDIQACHARGVQVTNTPDVLNDAVAELTLGLMIALCRRIVQADAFVRSGDWPRGPYPLTGELTGASVGILGLGRIGKEIARRCTAFRMDVVYHGRHAQPDQPYRYHADLVEMARAVDWLVVVAPGAPDTTGLVSRAVLEALGPAGCLVNVSRGALVDEAALVTLLQAGQLGGAALDVFADEPHVPEALRSMDRVVLSPHQGSATVKTRRAMGDLVVKNLLAHLRGEPLLTPVA